MSPIKDLDDYLSAVYKHGTGTLIADNRAGLSEIESVVLFLILSVLTRLKR